MKGTLILGALCLALASCSSSPVPDWYYTSQCQQPDDVSLEQWLPHALPIEEYEKNVFDCSELSAYAEWLAENCGYDTIIVVARRPGKLGRHSWVVVEGRTLDAETGVWDAEQWLPEKIIVELDDLGEALEYDSSDWNWWIVKPELRN